MAIAVNPIGLGAGTYLGAVTIAALGSVPQTVPVTLVVNAATTPPGTIVTPPGQIVTQGLAFGMSSLSFSITAGGSAPAQTVALSCSSSAAPFTASASSAGNWLAVRATSGNTPASLTVSVSASTLSAGIYTGYINAAAAVCGIAPTVAISLTVTGGSAGGITAGVAINPPSLAFSYQSGGVSPASQALAVTGSAGTPFTLTGSIGAGWLSVNPLSATAPANVTVSVNPSGLASGTYTSFVSIASGGSSQNIPVILAVTGGTAPAPIISPLSFSYQSGGALPAPQFIQVTTVPFTVTTSDAWLTATAFNPIGPATVTVTVNPAGLASGIYNGSVTVRPSAGSGSVQVTPVTLEVTGQAAPSQDGPHLTSLRNSGSLLSSPIAPGEIITIFGSGLGPADQQTVHLTPANRVDTTLGGTRVIIDGKPSPLLLSQDGQINAIVPYSVAGKSAVDAQVEYLGVRSAAASFSVADAAPAIFTSDGSGHGQAALLNQDTSVNFDLNPADRGSVAVLYATGAGLMSPASQDGAITGLPLARPLLAVSVLVDGQNAELLYAGSAPGQVSGVLQVNFRIPTLGRPGAVGLLLKVGRFTSQTGVTMAVR